MLQQNEAKKEYTTMHTKNNSKEVMFDKTLMMPETVTALQD